MWICTRVSTRGTVTFTDIMTASTESDCQAIRGFAVKSMLAEDYLLFSSPNRTNTDTMIVYKVFQDLDLSLGVTSMAFTITEEQ